MTKKKKLKVAITGSIGSGKTTFSNFLVQKGYPVIFADDVSKEILSKDLSVRKSVASVFGENAYSGDKINKKYLAANIFANPDKLNKINSILHPRVREKVKELSNKYFVKNDFVFIEAALIYESKIEKMYDFVVLISADEKIRERRSINSKNFSREDFKKRNDAQFNEETKINKADFVFFNNNSRSDLKQKAGLLISILKSYINKTD
ncbi:MAG: dephospho-CoA kinase [Ignavibacteria bacterium]|nr:dephospho-CoA kinase [Ignavibacteria bacterium]MBT8381005.1 dephospho-CoA kinase [Ignavibacteria bacterium]MBT8391505.1 dephospho-CoA kinase [Ignavibacteria bacterium]NNJ51655.1 dephospho-CoA kinase [Ignavibacteriaceae bacterium]NNL22391.1 dephospho-CoA kinase [Ignavibacteriaceae bacterium]